MYDNYWAQYQTAADYRQMQRQEQMAEEYRQDCREVQKEGAKTEIRVNARLYADEIKRKRKEEEEERKRGIFEQVAVSGDGEIIVTTQNLQVQAADRKLTNMRSPQMHKLRRQGDLAPVAYLLTCQVGGKQEGVFLDAKKIGDGTYVLKKLAAEGIAVMYPAAKAKEYIRQLMALLLGGNVPEITVYDEPGWIKGEEGKFEFIAEEVITWDKLAGMI